MRIKVKVHPGAKQEKFVKLSEGEYEVWFSEKPIDGKANVYLEKLLKKELGFKCKVVSGFTSRFKVVEIID